MKIATLIARLLLGAAFALFGLNAFFHFIPEPLPPGDAGAMLPLMIRYGWQYVLGGLYLTAGVLLLANRYLGIALTLLGPPLAVILLFHATMMPQGIALVLFLVIVEVFLIHAHWRHFASVFSRR